MGRSDPELDYPLEMGYESSEVDHFLLHLVLPCSPQGQGDVVDTFHCKVKHDAKSSGYRNSAKSNKHSLIFTFISISGRQQGEAKAANRLGEILVALPVSLFSQKQLKCP